MDAQAPDQQLMSQVPMDRLRSIFDGMFDGVWLVAIVAGSPITADEGVFVGTMRSAWPISPTTPRAIG